MSELRIFRPTEDEAEENQVPTATAHVDLEILPFDRRTQIISGRVSPRRLRSLNRARILFENQKCAFCNKATVEPLELDDALVSRKNNRPVPGTASIVGFHCHSCEKEWPVYETRVI